MAAQPEAGADLVTVCTDATDGGTLVRVVAPSRHLRMADLMPVFEALDLNLVSYTAERDPDANGSGAIGGLQAPLGRRKHSFRGRFLVTDADGQNLSEALLDGLVAALQDALHIRLSRPPRCSALNEESRRGSVASYGTDVSMDPDSPSFSAAAAHHAQGHFGGPGAQYGGGAAGSHGVSHLNPGAQYYSTHHHLSGYPHPAPHPYHSLPQLHPHPHHQQQPQTSHPHHHEHTASAGSMLMSDLSASSVGSLLRAASGATSDHPTVPSPPAMSRHDTISFTSLQQQHSDAAFIDTTPQVATGAAAGMVGPGGVACDERDRYMVGPTTPFASAATAAYPAQYTHPGQYMPPQLPPQPPSQASDMLENSGSVMRGRVSSACSTPPNLSGPLTLINATTSPQPESSSLHVNAAAPLQSPPLIVATAGAGPGSVACGNNALAPASANRSPHVSFYEPLPACISASTSAVATSATTPLHSRPPSASTSFISGGTNSLPLVSHEGSAGFACQVATACDAAAAAAVAAAAVERTDPRAATSCSSSDAAVGPGTGHGNEGGGGGEGGSRQGGAGAENGSPTSSCDDRDGVYTWWSTFSAQDSVARIMSHPARSISAEADLGQAKSLMTKHNISALLVNTGGPSPGFITKRDFLKVQFSKNFKRTKVKDVMTQPVIFVDISLPIEQCSRVLEAHGVRRVLVHDPSRVSDDDPLSAFVGVVSDADLFKCMGAPAMSPVVGSIANSAEQLGAHNAALAPYGADLVHHLPGTHTLPLPHLPSLPGLHSLPASAASQPLPGTPSANHHVQSAPDPLAHQQSTPQLSHGQPQLAPQPPPLQPSVVLSSAASTASVSVSNSAGPSHAASYVGAVPVDAAVAAAAGASAASAASGLAMAGSGGAIVRLNAEASLADRYRCAAALWELDFTELEVTRRIGEGSFGEVLLASFRGTKVAVKRLRGFDVGPDNPDTGAPGETGPSPTQMPIFRQFFEREIEILATIRHPNVVNFIGACHTPPNVCLVTEYCARGSLDHLLHKSSITIDLLKKVEFSMDIARGMSCLHSQKPPIIHRDLKTANLLVSARFEVKVADFGLSRIKDHAQLINSRAGLEGTVEYAAPEVLRGEPYTEKCDIWSYAVLLWEIIHRQRPYADADVPIYILMMSLGNGSLRLPPVRDDMATPGLARLVERCMAWYPTERPSFREVLHALEAEYKILRGKAAAVPRSDSASSMMVLPGSQNRPAAADGGSAATAAGPPSHDQPHNTAQAGVPKGAAGRQVQVQLPPPAHGLQPHPHPALPMRKSSKLGLNPHGGANAGGADGGPAALRGPSEGSASQAEASQHYTGLWDPHHHDQNTHYQTQQQPVTQQPASRPRVKLSLPPQQYGNGNGGAGGGAGGAPDTPEPVSPADSSSRPSSSRTGGTGNAGSTRGAAGGSKPSSAGRPPGRSLRSAARSKSMPLPEFEWFAAEDGFDDYIDTTESIADEDGDAAPSTATSTSGVTTAVAAAGGGVGAHAPHPLDRGGIRSTPYPDAASLYPVASDGVGDGVSDELPHHLVVRVPHHGAEVAGRAGAGDVAGGSGSITATAATARSQVSAFAAAAAMALPDYEEDEESAAAASGRHWALGNRGSSAGRDSSQRSMATAATVAGGPDASSTPQGVTSATSAAASAAATTATVSPRLSPFHMASNSPFANAADLPWSPRGSDEAEGSLATRLSSRLPPSSSQAILAAQQPTPEPTPSVVAVAAAPPRRVAFVSPFAQLATEAPERQSKEEEDDNGNDAQSGREDSSQRLGAWDVGPGTARGPAATAPATANSADVNTATEKDQRAPTQEPGWGLLGTCSKPPSGDVYGSGNGNAGTRVSPNAPRPPSPPTLAAVYAAASRVPVLAGDADLTDGDRPTVMLAAPMATKRSTAEEEEETMQELSLSHHLAQQQESLQQQLQEREAQLLVTASTGLDVLQRGLPEMPPGAFGIPGVTGGALDSDQFDDEDDEDAALHTTAWVRL